MHGLSRLYPRVWPGCVWMLLCMCDFCVELRRCVDCVAGCFFHLFRCVLVDDVSIVVGQPSELRLALRQGCRQFSVLPCRLSGCWVGNESYNLHCST